MTASSWRGLRSRPTTGAKIPGIGTGARTPKPDAYPELLRAALTALRDEGVDVFGHAWATAVQTLGVPEGWDHPYPERTCPRCAAVVEGAVKRYLCPACGWTGKRAREGRQREETPLEFARRHFEAAWSDEAPLRYCQAEGCVALTERHLCPRCQAKQRRRQLAAA